jgi:hypothetical protein
VVAVSRFLILLSGLLAGWAHGHDIEIRRLDELRKALGVDQYDSVAGVKERLKTLKIAVLDKGFGDSGSLAR